MNNAIRTASVLIFLLASFIYSSAQKAPNCRDFNASVNLDGSARFSLTDFVTNIGNGSATLTITRSFGEAIYGPSQISANSVVTIDACRLLREQLKMSVSVAGGGSCWSHLTFKQSNGPILVGRSKDVYCFDPLVLEGDIDGAPPTASIPCFDDVEAKHTSDWIENYQCTSTAGDPVNDTAKVIYREYEAFDKEGRRGVAVDTITVFNLPAVEPMINTYCAEKDTTYCGDGFAGPYMLIPERCDPGVLPSDFDGDGENCDTIYFLTYDTTMKMWVENPIFEEYKCGLLIHADKWVFGEGSCEQQTKYILDIKQSCQGVVLTDCLIDPALIASNGLQTLSPGHYRCEFWITDLDTLPPTAICKGDPFFKDDRSLDKWTFNTIRDFDFIGGLGGGPFDDQIIPDELTMLDTSKAPYSMCFASEQIFEDPNVYLGLNTAFIEAEKDMEFTFNWDFLLGEFDDDMGLFGGPGAIGLMGYGINGTFYKLVEGIEEPLLDEFDEYQEYLDMVMAELELDQDLCNLNLSLFLEDSWGSTTIRLEEGDVFTMFGVWISNADTKVQFSGQNIVSTTTHECAAHAYVPPLLVKEDWSGIKQVKATVENIGTVILDYDADEGCYVSHQKLKLPHRELPYEIKYEVYDSCHNIGVEYCYLLVKDYTRPVAVSDKGVTVSISDKKIWVDAAAFDEGSWDNCGVNLLLARRADWAESCVDLCYNVKAEAKCDPQSEEDYESAVEPIWTDGHDTLWCLVLEDDKACDAVEAHYAKQMQWWCEDGVPCGELLYNGWSYDLIKYATLHCRDNHYLDEHGFNALIEKALRFPDADPSNLLDGLIEEKFKCVKKLANAECILPFTFGRFPLLEFLLAGPGPMQPTLQIPTLNAAGNIDMMYLEAEHAFCGYNDAELRHHLDEWSQLGGGWSEDVPFSCEDACGPVTVEILVMDYWCNWTKAWTNVWVEDKTPIKVEKDVVAEEQITCKSYKDARYDYPGEDHPVSIEYIIEQSKTGDSTALAQLDNIFGGYEKAWTDPYNNYVDIEGDLIECDIPFYDSICDCTTDIEKVRVYDDHHGYVWKDSLITDCFYDQDTLDFQKGIVVVNCADNVYCEQEVWCDFDHCGQGYIFRKWKIWQGCPASFYEDKNVPDSLKHPVDTITRHQRIWIGNECKLNKHMFDVPGDVTVYSCDVAYDESGSGQITGVAGPENTGYATYNFDDDCRIVGIAHEDKVFKVVGGEEACYKIVRTWYFADWCGTGGVPAKDNWWHEGEFVVDSCVQKIIVVDTVAPVCVITGPVEDGGSVQIGGCSYDLEVEVDASDACGINRYYWELKDLTNDKDPVTVDSGDGELNADTLDNFTITSEDIYPGYYKLKVSVQDDCSNESYCEYHIKVDSGKKPAPVCVTSVTARLTPWDTNQDGEVDSAHAVVWAEEFNSSSALACDDDSIAFRIEFIDEVGDSTYIDDADSLSLGCADIGTHLVRLWVLSYPSGTADYCDVVLIVQSDFSGCGDNVGTAGNESVQQIGMQNEERDKGAAHSMMGGVKELRIPADAAVDHALENDSYVLGQNRPNPFREETTVDFYLPTSMTATVTVFDVTGRTLRIVTGDFTKGANNILFKKEDIGADGILYYQLRAGDFVATKKMLLMK